MHGSYRRIFIAAVGWLALCGAQPPAKQPDSGKGAQKAAPSTQAAPTPAPSATASPPSKFTPHPDYNADACYRANDKDAADLCAQWRAAIAAEKAAHEARRANIFALVAATLSFATVIGLIVTIWQTHGALGEARRGNRLNLLFERRSRRESRKSDLDQARALELAEQNAAHVAAQVNIAQATATHHLRAYVEYHSFEIKDFEVGKHALIRVVLINLGQTPARNLTIKFASNVSPEIGNFSYINFESISANNHGPLGSGHSVVLDTRTPHPITRAQYDRVRNKTAEVVAFGLAQYEDIFGNTYLTEYRRIYGGARGIQVDDGAWVCEVGNEAT